MNKGVLQERKLSEVHPFSDFEGNYFVCEGNKGENTMGNYTREEILAMAEEET